MNKVGLLLDELHDAETGLARDYREIGERHATDRDIWHMCHTLSKQAEARAAAVRELAAGYDKDIAEPGRSDVMRSLLAEVRRGTAELAGRRPEPGLLLLRDLRQLYLAAEEVSWHWIVLGQVAQALRDAGLLELNDRMHRQVLTEVKWLKTRAKEAAPQVICVG